MIVLPIQYNVCAYVHTVPINVNALVLYVNILLQYINFKHGFLKSHEISIMQLSLCFNYTFKTRNAAVAIVHLVSSM